MSGFSNNMTLLLNKIERRLGVSVLNLPDDLKKEKWADNIIIPDTLVTFSRYYPNEVKYVIEPATHPKKNGMFYIDEDFMDGIKILGVKDISWADFGQDSMALQQNAGYGIYDFLTQNYGMDDVALLQMRADHMSIFNNSVYPIFEPPNKIRIESTTGSDVASSLGKFTVILLIEHNSSLTTISATMMEAFEALAQADIAGYLYRNLKYYDGLQTVYATIDLKLSDLENEMNKRDDIINTIKESYVSTSNKNQPYIWTV